VLLLEKTAYVEFRNVIFSPNIVIRTMKSSRMAWMVHAERLGEMCSAFKVLIGKPDLGVEGKLFVRRKNRLNRKDIRTNVRTR
jgi:hypothetical protein